MISLPSPSMRHRFSQPLWRMGKVGLSVLCTSFLLLILFFLYGIGPNPWYRVLYVDGGSMAPTINPGDLIIITPPTAQLQPGTILTLQVHDQLVTHRLVGIQSHGELITQGDANLTADEWGSSPVRVRGIYRFKVPYLGFVYKASQNLVRVISTHAWFIDQDGVAGGFSTGTWATPTPVHTGTSLAADLSAEGYGITLPDGQITGVHFNLCLTNPGDHPTQGLTATAFVQVKPKHADWQTLDSAPIDLTTHPVLAAGESTCFTGQIPFTPPAGASNYRLIVQATITNHSGWQVGDHNCPGPDACPKGPEPKAGFELPDLGADSLSEALSAAPLLETPTETPTALPTGTPAATEASPTTTVPAPAVTETVPAQAEPTALPGEPTQVPTQAEVTPVPTEPTQPPTQAESTEAPAPTEPALSPTEPEPAQPEPPAEESPAPEPPADQPIP